MGRSPRFNLGLSVLWALLAGSSAGRDDYTARVVGASMLWLTRSAEANKPPGTMKPFTQQAAAQHPAGSN